VSSRRQARQASIHAELFDAQEARRVLDRLVGYLEERLEL
jgi:DNA topoisomerase IA